MVAGRRSVSAIPPMYSRRFNPARSATAPSPREVGVLDAVLTRPARGTRIVLSGGVSQYNAQQTRGPSNYLQLIAARASMIGILTPDYADR